MPNDLGLRTASRFPAREKALEALCEVASRPGAIARFWAPALPLYVALWAVVVFAWRQRDQRLLWLAALPFVHSLILGLAVLAPEVRFQYSILLFALFAPVLLTIARPSERALTS